MKIYNEKTGKLWPYSGYYSELSSLCYPLPIRKGTAAGHLYKSMKDQSAIIIVMSGRNIWFRRTILGILFRYDMFTNYLILKPNREYDTLSYKADILYDLVKYFPSLKDVHLWDDDMEHLKWYKEEFANRFFRKNNVFMRLYCCTVDECSIMHENDVITIDPSCKVDPVHIKKPSETTKQQRIKNVPSLMSVDDRDVKNIPIENLRRRNHKGLYDRRNKPRQMKFIPVGQQWDQQGDQYQDQSVTDLDTEGQSFFYNER